MIQADLLGERARLTPDAPALVVLDPPMRLDYRAFDRRARACAAYLRDELGLAKGERVAILAHNRVEFLDAFFACGKTGHVLVTLGTRLTAPELRHIVEDCAPRVVLWDGAFADTVHSLRTLLEPEIASRIRWVALDAAPYEGESGEADAIYPLSRDLAEPDLTRTETFEGTPCDGEDLYCLLYTSGTTGEPKGVQIPHRQIAWNAVATSVSWALGPDDVTSIFTPLYHAGGLTAFLTPIVAAGGTVVLHDGFDAAEVWRTIERERVTVALGVPTLWSMLAEAPELETVDLASVRWLISGGAPLPEHLVETYGERGIVLKQGFGMTEVGVNCFSMTRDDATRRRGSIGRPLFGTEIRLVDEAGRDVDDDEVGEMLLRGPHVSQGYWNRPRATAEALDADGWFHSGDLARRDADGFFWVAGRSKDVVISGGVNIYPAEIEAALLLHSSVADAAVVGVPEPTWGETVVAFVLLRQTSRPAETRESVEAALREHLAGHLARYKIPRVFRFVDDLPRTAYGKVIKGELRSAFLAEDETGDTGA